MKQPVTKKRLGVRTSLRAGVSYGMCLSQCDEKHGYGTQGFASCIQNCEEEKLTGCEKKCASISKKPSIYKSCLGACAPWKRGGEN